MGYISEVQIDGGDVLPVGSSLYGVCESLAPTAAKVVTLPNFNAEKNGVTVHVRFIYGNSAPLSSPLTLKVGAIDPYPITNPGGSVAWSENAVISFTFDGIEKRWMVNDGNVSTIAVEQTYIQNSSEAISGAGVADALNTLGSASHVDTTQQIIESGANANKTEHTIVPTVGAITEYVDNKVSGITGAMHFVGRTTTTMSDGLTTATVIINGANYTPIAGDVVLSDDHQEYVWVVTNTSTGAGYWELLGDEGSYLYANQVENTSVVNGIQFSAGTFPSVTLDDNATSVLTSVSNTSAAKATSAEVTNGILRITTGILPQFNTGSVRGVTSVSNGVLPTLTPTTTEVLKTKEN